MRQEFAEHARAVLRAHESGVRLPIATLVGLVKTDIGLGVVTEKVKAPDGGLAPTLNEVFQRQDWGHAELDAVNSIASRLISLDVRARDLSAKNIVLGHRASRLGSGQLEAVLIDGFGDVHAVPIRSWSRRANRHAINRKLAKIARSVSLDWNVANARFSRA